MKHVRPAAILLSLVSFLVLPDSTRAQEDAPRLFTEPDLSASQVCFGFAGDLWLVPRAGGTAHRLTASPGSETRCRFSPDGQQIAYTATRENNTDVYVVGAEGGTPTRLTWHPGPDITIGWTPDGKVLFASLRDGHAAPGLPLRLYTQEVDGVMASAVDLPSTGLGASFSPDGSHLAYMPILAANAIWKRYRGGRTTPIWIARLSDAAIEKLPRENSTDTSPMWVDETVFFLSDREGPTTLYSYDLVSKEVTRRIENNGLDIKSAQAGPGAIVFEQFGQIRLFDLDSGQHSQIPISLEGELTASMPQWVNVGSDLSSGAISPTGVRAAFLGRGEIITVPAEKGDARNITNTPGIMERHPVWSPNGQTLAYFTEASGQYQLEIRPQDGMGPPRQIPLGGGDRFFYAPTWSPDGNYIAFSDSRGEIWYLDVESEETRRIDVNPAGRSSSGFPLSWSNDSRWIAYHRQIPNLLSAVFVFDRTNGTTHQITDGMSDASNPVFDADGEYLYFVASTDAGPAADFSMSTFDHPVTQSLYAIVLRKDLPSPLAPESDEESPDDDPGPGSTPENTEKPDEGVRIDFDAIDQRTIPLPTSPKNYVGLATGAAGTVILAENPQVPVAVSQGGTGATLHKFDLQERETTELIAGVTAFDVSRDGKKILYRRGGRWAIAGLGGTITPGDGALATGSIQVQTDPQAEWAQMYHEAFRFQRAFFYDPNYHGLDLDATEQYYARFLPGLGSREDLDYLFAEAFGNLTVGHLYVSGPDGTRDTAPPNGLLGADYTISNGRWQFSRVLSGENWNPQMRAPLTQPGVNVEVGEYLLAVNGIQLTASENVNQAFAGTAGKQVTIRVGPEPDGTGAREVTVVPTGSEVMLRHLAWIDGNRQKVDSLSDGRLAYLYIPDTSNDGYTRFNRYFFSQRDKAGAVVDERYNGGGNIADYMVYYLQRTAPFNYVTQRYGEDLPIPVGIYGPKVMLINEYAGSGGDELPWLFRRYGVGPLVGTRTWGGLVGIGGYPSLMDGGSVTAPHIAIWSLEGEYEVENQGVAPDVEVEVDPGAWRDGHDVQLERAVAILLEELERSQFTKPVRPPFPNWASGHTPGRGGSR